MKIQEQKINCFNCNKETELSLTSKIMRSEECPHCYANFHSCRMCQFYDPSAYNECRESSAERILEKESANFCDYFILIGRNKGKNVEQHDNAANALFKN